MYRPAVASSILSLLHREFPALTAGTLVIALGAAMSLVYPKGFRATASTSVGGTPTAIDIAKGTGALEAGQWRQLTATARFKDGSSTDVTRKVAWSSGASAVVTVDAAGRASAWQAGSARLTATVGGVTGQTTLTVTRAPPPPPEGPGGPILVVSSAANPFGRYLAEILRAEGLNEFLAVDIGAVTRDVLAGYDVVLLGEMPLTAAQVAMLGDWVAAGGHLVAMRPDRKLAPLLGLGDVGGPLADAYLLVNTAAAPGAGIVGETIQFHGAADEYTVSDPGGLTVVATLCATPTSVTGPPAVTMRTVGAGTASAFTYDLARSVVLTRQGNPAWSGQERDERPPIRANELFFGVSGRDWIDFGKVRIPQADEQQRLLANLVLHVSTARRPLPRFWYLPSRRKAVVVMTGDDHAKAGIEPRFRQYMASSAPGCAVGDWRCIRGSAYMFPATPLDATRARELQRQGFELSIHVDTGCNDWSSYEQLDEMYASQLAAFAKTFPGVRAPRTHRTHCIVWSDYDTQPKVELAHGMRLDTSYYYWPGSWVANRPGFMTGSGMPMRFADRTGRTIDVYQAATQMTDESGQRYPFTVDTLLDGALRDGWYGAFIANMHTDDATSLSADMVLASARARGVAVISAAQLLDWVDARNASSFGGVSFANGVLTFKATVAAGARSMYALLPAAGPAGALKSLSADTGTGPAPLAYDVETIKGISYAVFPAQTGRYTAVYARRVAGVAR